MNNPMHALASAVTDKFIAADPTAAAKALETLATHEVLLLISSLKAQVMVAVLNPMDPPKAAAVLRRLPLRQHRFLPGSRPVWTQRWGSPLRRQSGTLLKQHRKSI